MDAHADSNRAEPGNSQYNKILERKFLPQRIRYTAARAISVPE
jgi:hypothetical protein